VLTQRDKRYSLTSAAAASGMGLAITTLGNLFLVPLYMTAWGVAAYGEWLAIYGLAAQIMTLDCGMNAAAANELRKTFVARDWPRHKEVRDAILSLYAVGGVLFGLILALALWWVPLDGALPAKELTGDMRRVTLWILAAQVLLSFPLGLYGHVLRSAGDLDRSMWLGNAHKVLLLLCTAACLLETLPPVTTATVQLAPTIALLVYYPCVLHRRYRGLAPQLTWRLNISVLREIRTRATFLTMPWITTTLTQHVPVVLISQSGDGQAVAAFVTCRTLTNVVKQVGSTVLQVLAPDATAAITTHNEKHFLRLYRIGCAVSLLLAAVSSTCLWTVGDGLIVLWTHGNVTGSTLLLRAFIMLTGIQMMWLTSIAFISATDNHRVTCATMPVAALMGLGIAGAILPIIGSVAFPLAFILSDTVVAVASTRDLRSLVGAAATSQTARWVVTSLLLCSLVAACIVAVSHVPSIWIRLTISGAAALPISAIVVWLAVLTYSDRRLILSQVGR
jgi:O-antigen/teichoic acid export membrane protein